MVAANKDFADIVKFLITQGVDVEKEDKFGKKAHDRTVNSGIFFMLTSKAMENRLQAGMNMSNSSMLDSALLNYTTSDTRDRSLKQLDSSQTPSQKSHRATPKTPGGSYNYDVLDSVFRKNLTKLK